MKAVSVAAAHYERGCVLVVANDASGRVWWRMVWEESSDNDPWEPFTELVAGEREAMPRSGAASESEAT